MLTLFHHPFCPHSRFVRLALGEYGIAARTVEERVWERRQEFLILNPACTTPVVVEEGRPAVPGAAVIAEYLDETRGIELGELRLLPREIGTRVEVRRLMSWFNDKFFAEVSGPLTTERLYKRQMPTSAGGGSPDTEVIRAARHNMRYHLAYIGWLVRTRDWLAGGRMSYADLAAAATYRRPTIWATCHGTKTRPRRPGTRRSSRARRSVRCWPRRWRASRRRRPTPTSTSERSGGAQSSARGRRAPNWLRHRRHRAA